MLPYLYLASTLRAWMGICSNNVPTAPKGKLSAAASSVSNLVSRLPFLRVLQRAKRHVASTIGLDTSLGALAPTSSLPFFF